MRIKSPILAFFILPTIASAATGRGASYTQAGVDRTPLCSPRVCALDDMAAQYAKVCGEMNDYRRATPFSHNGTYGIFEVTNTAKTKVCICSCGWGEPGNARDAVIRARMLGLE